MVGHNAVANSTQDGGKGCNTIVYTTASLYSDWLYFSRHGIKCNKLCTSTCRCRFVYVSSMVSIIVYIGRITVSSL